MFRHSRILKSRTLEHLPILSFVHYPRQPQTQASSSFAYCCSLLIVIFCVSARAFVSNCISRLNQLDLLKSFLNFNSLFCSTLASILVVEFAIVYAHRCSLICRAKFALTCAHMSDAFEPCLFHALIFYRLTVHELSRLMCNCVLAITRRFVATALFFDDLRCGTPTLSHLRTCQFRPRLICLLRRVSCEYCRQVRHSHQSTLLLRLEQIIGDMLTSNCSDLAKNNSACLTVRTELFW